MGCNTSVAASGSKPLLLHFNDAKVKARLQEVLLKSVDGVGIVGLPTVVKGEHTLNDAPEDLQDLHYGIKDHLAAAPMRLLKITSILSSSALTCYEDVKSTDYLEIAYSKVTDAMWQKTVALSWRWNKSKPKTKASEFSPMSSDQWEELHAILREAEKHGLEWIWIDWSCVVQYDGDPMIEIQRSRLYYMRCGAFIVVSDFTPIPDSGPVKVLLVKVLRMLKKSVGEKGDEDSVIEQALVKVIEVVLEKKTVASLEYFGRAWTLAERMSRGRPEFLCQWMSLNTWIGMVVDAMLKSTADKKASAIYRTILRQEGSALLDFILGPLALAVESGSTMHASMDGLESKVVQLLVLAAKIWTCSNIPQETPTREWLRKYLLVTLGTGVYDAWEKKDLIWSVYSYFTWKTPIKTDIGVTEAIHELAVIAGLPVPSYGPDKILPELFSSYKALGLSEAVGAIERAREAEEARKAAEAEAARKAEEARRAAAEEAERARKAAEAERARQAEETRRVVEAERARQAEAARQAKEARMAAQLSPTISSEIKVAAFKAMDKYGVKPFVNAAEKGDEGAVRTLIVAGYTELEETDANGNTALIMAAKYGHKITLNALLDADLNKNAKNNTRSTALIQAAINGQHACIRLLEDAGADKDIKDIDGLTYLDHAAKREKAHEVAMAAKQKYGSRKTLLIATEWRDEEAVKALLAVGYSDVNESDRFGYTVLMRAAEWGCDSIVQALLDAGANKDARTSAKVETALFIATKSGHEGCVKLLVKAGANRNIESRYLGWLGDQYGTPLDIAETESIKAILRS